MRRNAKTIEVRRHVMRRKPGQHLSAQGISLARKVMPQLGIYDRVVCSTLSRSVETAVALGYAVDESIETLGTIPDNLLAQVGWPNSIDQIAVNLRENDDLRLFAEKQFSLWKGLLVSSSDEINNILIISHGAIMELGLIAATKSLRIKEYGAVFGYCEAFRLTLEEGNCIGFEPLRLGGEDRIVEN